MERDELSIHEVAQQHGRGRGAIATKRTPRPEARSPGRAGCGRPSPCGSRVESPRHRAGSSSNADHVAGWRRQTDATVDSPMPLSDRSAAPATAPVRWRANDVNMTSNGITVADKSAISWHGRNLGWAHVGYERTTRAPSFRPRSRERGSDPGAE